MPDQQPPRSAPKEMSLTDTGHGNLAIRRMIIAVLVLFGFTVGLWVGHDLSKKTEETQVVYRTVKSSPTPPTPSPTAKFFGWSINIPASRALATSVSPNQQILYATQQDDRVTVSTWNIVTGETEPIFDYSSAVTSARSGNTWQELPPALNYSSANQQFVLATNNGLETRALDNPDIQPLITQVVPSEIEYEPPEWSVEAINAFQLLTPRWSHNGRYISFSQAHYEGLSHGLYDAQDQQYYSIENGRSLQLRWSPTRNQYVVAGSLNASAGLHISDVNDISKTNNLWGDTGGSALIANFSPDGNKLTAINEGWNNDGTPVRSAVAHLLVINVDGTDLQTIREIPTENIGPLEPFFSPDGSKVFFTEHRNELVILLSYSLSNQETSEVAALPPQYHAWQSPTWISEGNLILTGLGTANNSSEAEGRIVMLDLDSNEVVFASPPLPEFIAYLGLR